MSRNKAEERNRILSGKKYGQIVYDLDEEGLWRIYGEDPNPDLCGPHHEPDLGTFEGTFSEAIDYAIDKRGFFSWGAGGRIVKVKDLLNKEQFKQVFQVEDKYFERESDLLEQYPGAAYDVYDVINIGKSTYLLASPHPIKVVRPDPKVLEAERLRKRALEKLTPAERKALGLE